MTSSSDLENKLKEVEIKYKEAELLLKINESIYKEKEINIKQLEYDRYLEESIHQKKLNKLIEDALLLKNVESRINILHSIGIQLNQQTDFKYIVELSKILGHTIDDNIVEKLDILKYKINYLRTCFN